MKSVFLALVLAVLTASTSVFGQAANASLYDRLGGLKAITAVVDDFVARAAADLGLAQADLAGELAAVESEVAAPLLRELGEGVTPTRRSGLRTSRGSPAPCGSGFHRRPLPCSGCRGCGRCAIATPACICT